MKRTLSIAICLILIFSLTSCDYIEREKQEIASMFDSFNKSENIILLTHCEFVLNGKHYNLEDITYNDQMCNIVFLDENGFYSYTYTPDNHSVEFLYTLYETFEVTSLGIENLPSKIIHAFWGDNSFWFRMDDPSTDEFKQICYSWNIDTKEVTIVDSDSISHNYEYSKDLNRSEKYSFDYESKFFGNRLKITDNESGITKKINRSVLKTFEEGKKIKKTKKATSFNIHHAFEDNGTIYLATIFGVNPLGDPCYYYIYTWNFETEQCEFYTSVYFDEYQHWLTDMYINT